MASSIFATLVDHKIDKTLSDDVEIKAAIVDRDFHFALQSDCPELLHVKLRNGEFKVTISDASDEPLALVAPEEGWKHFFSESPPPPYQSYWGMLRVLGKQRVCVKGDPSTFARNARVWRLVLDRMRRIFNNQTFDPLAVDFGEVDDSLVGRYVWIDNEHFGKCKMFYESAGNGRQAVVFLHTAGADSRQYHSIMNDKQLQKRVTMFAFDMPGHGRSYPGTRVVPQGYRLNETTYVDIIRQMISKLNIRGCIVSGASMAGHVCLAVALRAAELGVIGVIPCEACDHVSSQGTLYGVAPGSNEAILQAEIVTGLMAPTTDPVYQRMIWWGYSSQAAGVFAGDLMFYFDGWDGRDRVQKIDTKTCPVYMLTGEYDYSCTPAASRATAEKIPGAVFTEMKGMGHFPATEDPAGFLRYFAKGLDFIEESHQEKAMV
jgi:pimeloyl-ACP methyl ester carboxylesterase